jgi:hypothetical protein
VTPAQEAVANLVALLLGGALVGLFVTGRIWLCRSFGLYLGSALATNRAVVWWPERFYTSEFWAVKETLQAALAIAVAVELADVALMAFPRARAVVRRGVLGVAFLTLLGVSAAIAGGYHVWVGALAPRASLGASWAMLVVVMVAAWYRLPLGPWHRMIALGFVLYQSVYAVLLTALAGSGWSAYSYIVGLEPAAYAATVGLWTFGAWRTEWLGAPREVAQR